jgi:hypothetical protein
MLRRCRTSVSNGHNLVTAVNGGGLAGSVAGVALNTNAVTAAAWETFKLILQPGSPPIGIPGMKFALETSGGNYVTAINGGGVGGANDATCPVHIDATLANAWEGFILEVDDTVNPPTVIIRTQTGNFVTAVNGWRQRWQYSTYSHRLTTVGTWEQFLFKTVPGIIGQQVNSINGTSWQASLQWSNDNGATRFEQDTDGHGNGHVVR